MPEKKEIQQWQQKQGIPLEAVKTRYWYSKTQWVSRFEWKNDEGRKEKTIRQGHIKSNGLIQWSKGPKDWRAYKLTEAVKHCAGKWVLGLEGERCVETARAIALSAITWQGSNWQSKAIASDVTIRRVLSGKLPTQKPTTVQLLRGFGVKARPKELVN